MTYYLSFRLGSSWKPRKFWIKTANNTFEIQTGYLPNKSLEPYQYTSLFSADQLLTIECIIFIAKGTVFT
jgi:hypothetical protein